MDVREKLVELVNDVLRYLPWGDIQKDTAERIVDRIMDHDVTVQEWIPVTKRHPDLELVDAKSDDFDLYACLVTVKNFRAKSGRYVKKAWYDGDGFIDEDCVDITYDVTHWMPLPEIPKEV